MDSSNKDKQFSIQPVPENSQGDDKTASAFQAHKAHPGPAIPENFDAKEEGTKEDRRAKAEALNK